MKKIAIITVSLALLLADGALALENVKLPPPEVTGGLAINQVIQTRRSIRKYKEAPISLRDLGQLLWSAQGITDTKTGHRAAPSAVATYPLKLYAVVKEGGVTGLPAGVYLYAPKDHSLTIVKKGNFYPDVAASMHFYNSWIEKSAVVFIFTGTSTLIEKLSKDSGMLFTDLEAGMAAENLLLESVSLGLGRCTIGGFRSEKAAALLGIDKNVRLLLIVSVGRPE